MEEVNKIITLCGKLWAKVGVEFIFLGGKEECENCKVKKVCLKLREGARYKIVGVKDSIHECSLHEEGVVTVEVVELPIIVLIDSNLPEKVKFRYEERFCTNIDCSMYNLCHPAELKNGDIVEVEKIIGEVPEKCSMGYNLVIAEISRK